MPTSSTPSVGAPRRSHGRGVRLVAGHTIRVGGGLRSAGGRRGESPSSYEGHDSTPGASWPRAILRHWGMRRWYVCMVDGNLPDRPRCTMFAHPCGDIPQERRQEGHRVAPSPGGVRGPSLWPSTLKPSCWCCALVSETRWGRWRSFQNADRVERSARRRSALGSAGAGVGAGVGRPA